MEDVEILIAELNKRDMHLVMDLVVNHTSDQVSSQRWDTIFVTVW